jgi:hypothetical protein
VIQGDAQAFEDVRPRFRLAQLELGPPPHYIATELDEEVDQLDQRQHARPAADDGQHDDAEGRLQLRVLEQVVQHHVRHFAALQLDDEPHALA